MSAIDESVLTKGQRRKLNALRKSIGDDIAEPSALPATPPQVLNRLAAGWEGLTLLDLAGSDEGGASWARWFAAVGRPASGPRYEVVDSHAQALEAAVAGCGLVLGWRHLIGRHVDAGTLVMQGGDFVETGSSFHAVLTTAGRRRPLARACLAFFGGEARHRAGWTEP